MIPLTVLKRPLLAIAKILKGKSNIDTLYNRIATLGPLWSTPVKVLSALGFDELLYVPTKNKLLPMPLNLSTGEKAVIDKFKPQQGQTVLDIGAYVGRYTLIASKKVGPTGKVIAVEAHPGICEIARKNVTCCRRRNITLCNLAASNREGKIRLFIGYGTGWHSIIEKNGKTGWSTSNYVEVTSKTVDTLLYELGVATVDWMKIDVEGSEFLVLQGSTYTLQNSPNLKLIVEIHPSYVDEQAVFNHLHKMHYHSKLLEEPNTKSYHIYAYKKRVS